MNTTYSLYNTESGAFTGARIVCEPSLLAINPPPAGHAWMQGAHSPYTARVELVAGDRGYLVPEVVVQAPALPPETAWASWVWDPVAEEPRPVPKLPLRQEGAKQPLLERLAELDKLVARPAGEITEAMALGDAPPPAAVNRLRAVNADKALVRTRMRDIDACTSIEQLEQLLATPLTLQTLEAL